MPKYHVTVELLGVKIRIKNIEAINQDEAEAVAEKRAKTSVKVIASCIAVEERTNAKPVSGEEMFKRFFG